MKKRYPISMLAAVMATLAFASAAMAVGTVTLFRSTLDGSAEQAQFVKGLKGTCKKGGSESALRLEVGKATRECAFRVPVVGRDIEVSATGRLFNNTPKALQKAAFVSVSVRSGEGGRYQLVVYPGPKRFQLRKALPGGETETVAGGKRGKLGGLGEPNKMRLRAFNDLPDMKKGTARVVAFVNGVKLAQVDDERGGEVTGRDTLISLGANKSATGAKGSFDNVQVKIPSPFG